MKQEFKNIQMSMRNREALNNINAIVEEYKADGYTLTLRQLYYQLVSRDMIANQQREYKKLSRLMTEGRMAGIVDWSAIEDRLRQVQTVVTWDNPKSILYAAKNQFRYDRLQNQSTYIEVWVEKDALSQVVTRAADVYQIPVMVNRGYGSISAMYKTYTRFTNALDGGTKERAIILYLGDHDPSGLDMVRDIRERLRFMLEHDGFEDLLTVEHIALTKEQIAQYNPPPNPAKVTDTRAANYIKEHGSSSWEVDALDPATLNDLIIEHIESNLDIGSYNDWKDKEAVQKDKIANFIKTF